MPELPTEYSATAHNSRQKIAYDGDLSLIADNCAAPQAVPAPSSNLVDALRARSAMIRDAQAAKRRRRARNRQRLHRATSRQLSATKLVNALRKRTAKPKGNKRIEQLAGREHELAIFAYLSRSIIDRHGPMSDGQLGRALAILGDDYTRKKVWQLRKIVAALQADGGPWHNL